MNLGDNSSSGDKRKIFYIGHTPQQTTRLEELFNSNPILDEVKSLEIAQELGMAPQEVKFWFRNKRNQKKIKEEKEINDAVCTENEMMGKGNDDEFKEKLKELMKNCQAACGDPSNSAAADGDNSIQQLQAEGDVWCLLVSYMENHPVPEPLSLQRYLNPTTVEREDSSLNLNLDLTLGNSSYYSSSSWMAGGSSSSSGETSGQRERITERERTLMVKVAKAAMEELVVLVSTNEPLWEINSANSAPRLVLNPQTYDIMSHRLSRVYNNHHFNNSTTLRVETSRDSQIVKLQAQKLVDAILNPACWTNMFPTIIPKALTLEVLEKGTEGTGHGALQLIYQEMHILSPLLPPREFFLLRFCQQLESNVWLIADVSFDHAKRDKPADKFRAWKRPSGCKIEALPDGTSRVTWVEHVLADDLFQTHPLFRDLLVHSGTAYGAEKWLLEIQRVSERFASFTSNDFSNYHIGGVMITLPGERRNLMRVCQRMVRESCGILKLSSKKEYNRNPGEGIRDNGIRFSIRDKTDDFEAHHSSSNDIIAVIAASIWLPFTSKHLFDFFGDLKTRHKWDSLCFGERVEEVAHFSIGTRPGNCISLIRHVNPDPKAMIIIQESFTSSAGSYIIYSPISVEDFYTAIHGDQEASIGVPLLLYGLTISDDDDDEDHDEDEDEEDNNEDGGGNTGNGSSLLTLTFQVPARKDRARGGGGGAFIKEPPPSLASATEFIAKIVEKIKVALDCPESDSEDDSDSHN